MHDNIRRLKPPVRHWFFISLISISLNSLFSALFFSSRQGYFSVNKYLYSLIAIPFIFLCVFYLFLRWLLPKLKDKNPKELVYLIFVSLFISLLFNLIVSMPKPDFSQIHSLSIETITSNNNNSKNSIIEIRNIGDFSGRDINLDQIQLSENWINEGRVFLSEGDVPAHLSVNSDFIGGALLKIRHNDQSGMIKIVWDNKTFEYDLYSVDDVTSELLFNNSGLREYSSLQQLFITLFFTLNLIAEVFLIFLFNLIISKFKINKSQKSILLSIIYIVLILLFLKIKVFYQEFNSDRYFTDTYAYVATSEYPLTSMNFWAGERSFTLPLVFKTLGVNLANYKEITFYRRVTQFQVFFSIFAWIFLAFTLSTKFKNKWLKPIVFMFVLFFSTTLEISIWDQLLLSESISFSLFALLLASWILFEKNLRKPNNLFKNIFYFLMVSFISILYSFSRDSNLYFILVSSVAMLLMAIIIKYDKKMIVFYNLYLLLALLLFLGQNFSLSTGNRWQILFYDHLAKRILLNESDIAFFVKQGMPLDESIIETTQMTNPNYQYFFMETPEMAPMRSWVNEKGKRSYLEFLISNPFRTIIEPMKHINIVLNDDIVRYRYPKYKNSSVPLWLQNFSNRLFPTQILVLICFLIISLFSIGKYLPNPQSVRSIWMIITLIFISLYPLLFVVWFGNPLEVGRHSAQIAIQYRLMGWLSMFLISDQFLENQLRKSQEINK